MQQQSFNLRQNFNNLMEQKLDLMQAKQIKSLEN